eukprot:COSAG01_NODE_38431_length_489_cov_5.651282_2_plen_28_part_01
MKYTAIYSGETSGREAEGRAVHVLGDGW